MVDRWCRCRQCLCFEGGGRKEERKRGREEERKRGRRRDRKEGKYQVPSCPPRYGFQLLEK